MAPKHVTNSKHHESPLYLSVRSSTTAEKILFGVVFFILAILVAIIILFLAAALLVLQDPITPTLVAIVIAVSIILVLYGLVYFFRRSETLYLKEKIKDTFEDLDD